MRSFRAMRWGSLAVLAVLAGPSTTWAQRSGDDADSYSDARNSDGNTEPPRLIRGGFMQQLRSVTESVMGTHHDDKPAAKPETRSGVPTPPPVNGRRATPESRGRAYAPEDFQSRDTEPNTAQRPSAGGRAWAGQFLIPNYRLRDQVGTRNYRNPAEMRRGNVPNDVPQVPQTARTETRPMITGGQVAAIPESNQPQRRVYLGQGTRVDQSNSETGSEGELPFDSAEEVVISNLPATDNGDAEHSSEFRMSDDEPAPPEPAEVLVSHVPDVPYVPRKPLPKRPARTVTHQATPSPGAAPYRTVNSPAAKTPSAAPSETASPAQPMPTMPSAPTAPALPPAQPKVDSKTPSLELSSKLQSDATKVSVPSVPSKPLPSANASKVLAQTVSTPNGNAVPSKPNSVPSLSPPTAPTASPSMPTLPPSLPTSLPPTLPPSLPTSLPTTASPTLPSTMPSVPSLEAMPTTPARPTAPLQPTLPSPSSMAPVSLPPATLPPASMAPAATPPATLPSSSSPPSSTNLRGPAANQARLHMEIPHIAVQLLGPGDLTAGTPTSYELQVHNSDRISLSGLVLRMETPAGVQIVPMGPDASSAATEKNEDGSLQLLWNVSQVNAGGTAKLPLQLTSSSPRNFAVAIEWTVLPQAGLDEIAVKQADLQVALEGPVDVEKHGSNAYRLRVSNPGTAQAKAVQVVVSTGSPENSAVEVGDLNPGQTEIIELDLTFEKAGQVQIGAVARSGSLSRSTNIQVNVRQPIVVAQLSLPDSVLHGSPMIAQAVIGNSGDAPARNLQAAMQLPAGTVTTQLPAGVTRDGDRLLWNIEQIPPGQEVQLPIEMQLAAPGTQELSLACVSTDGSVVQANAKVTIEAYADLKLLVNDPVAPAPVGSPVTYELTITNRGTRDAKNVQIVAQFSDGIEPETASGWNHQVVPGQVRFESIPQIAAGQSVLLKVVAKASIAGVHRFRAEVRCEDNEARLVEEESTRYLETTGRIAAPPATTIQR